MVSSPTTKGIYIWKYKLHTSYLALATDYILLAADTQVLYDILCNYLHEFFTFTSSSENTLSFLNIRIIQSTHGISIDQTNHIKNNILKPYWKNSYTTGNIKYFNYPFPKDPKFESTLYNASPLTGKDLQYTDTKYGGSIAHWVGELINITTNTRLDISYATMRISGFMSCPKLPVFLALHQLMAYLYHHPHLPIIYPMENLKVIVWPAIVLKVLQKLFKFILIHWWHTVMLI